MKQCAWPSAHPHRFCLLEMNILSLISHFQVNERLLLILGRLSLLDVRGIQSSVSTWPSPCGGHARVQSLGQSGWVHIGSREDAIKVKCPEVEPEFAWNCSGSPSPLQLLTSQGTVCEPGAGLAQPSPERQRVWLPDVSPQDRNGGWVGRRANGWGNKKTDASPRRGIQTCLLGTADKNDEFPVKANLSSSN